MVVTLGQQYNNIGEKSTVILYTYINRHAETPEKQQKRKHCINSTSSNMVVIVIIYCYIGCEDKATTWYLNGFPMAVTLGQHIIVRSRSELVNFNYDRPPCLIEVGNQC